jgi:hypothetical protein
MGRRTADRWRELITLRSSWSSCGETLQSSPEELQGKLNHSAVTRREDAEDLTEGRVGYRVVRIVKINLVEDIKEFATELNLVTLLKRKILENPKVCVAEGGPAQNIPPRLPILTQEVVGNAVRRAILLLDRLGVKRLRSECADRAHKGVGVEELVDHGAAARVIQRDRLAGEEGVFGRPRPIHRYVGATVESNG